ncbi:DsbA family protein [Sphingomonas parva]|uniref:DsbA family protein n=1 Tax=Sphingomonas parva TaxID=2555898 RepID=UPI001CDC0652|nr:DsbA family protein [Sphingomonas parva]
MGGGALLLNAGPSGAQTAEPPLTRDAVTSDVLAPTRSPKDQNITIVVFQDYQCPVCRKVHPDIERLLASDKRIRVVYRDWPIFGGASIEAAKAAIASNYQGRHAAFNDALMRMPGRLSSETIRAAAAKAGVDWARLQSDLDKHKGEIDALISRNNRMAPAIGLQGTPAFIIGSYLIPGGMDLANLKETVKMARENPGEPEMPEAAEASGM